MGLFSKKPAKAETRAFGRGQAVSAAAAEKYAKDKARKAAFAKRKRAALKGRRR